MKNYKGKGSITSSLEEKKKRKWGMSLLGSCR